MTSGVSRCAVDDVGGARIGLYVSFHLGIFMR